MARRDDIGPFEREVLETLLSHPRDAYGVSILERLSKRTGRTHSIGALYTTLERLERKGFIRSWWGEPTAARGGRRKRLYEIEPSGAQAVLRAENATVGGVGMASLLGQGA